MTCGGRCVSAVELASFGTTAIGALALCGRLLLPGWRRTYGRLPWPAHGLDGRPTLRMAAYLRLSGRVPCPVVLIFTYRSGPAQHQVRVPAAPTASHKAVEERDPKGAAQPLRAIEGAAVRPSGPNARPPNPVAH